MDSSFYEISLSKDEQNKIRLYADVLDLSIDEVIHKMLSHLAYVSLQHVNKSLDFEGVLNEEIIQNIEIKSPKVHKLYKSYKKIAIDILKDYPEGLTTDEMLVLFPEGANKGTLSSQLSELFQYGILNRTRTKPKRYTLATQDEKTD